MAIPPLGPNPSPVSGHQPPRHARRLLHLPRSAVRKALFLGVYLAFCWGVVFLGAKLFWKFRAGVPFDETAFVLDYYFPEIRLSKVKETHPRYDDGFFDVLLLGGSVLEPGWGNVEEELRAKLQGALGDRFRVFNLAHSAHTSRDSLLKYRELAWEQFDLVIVYDGINDVRLNCCPRESFRDDYSHFAWYRSMQKHIDAGTMRQRAGVIEQARVAAETFAFDSSDDALLEEGGDIKTARPFRRNLEEIAWTATGRGDAVLMSTYAYYIPADYTQERFRDRTLDYAFRADGRSCDAETWGKPRYVAAAIDVQNDALRALMEEHPEMLFVDERKAMPEQGRLFVDPCHLTEDGSRQFVDNLWPAVMKRLRAWKGARDAAARDREARIAEEGSREEGETGRGGRKE
ncbi:MAG: hypothetical protein ACM3U2_20605 [Deltaproteobacteria bacterium]